jgi:AraC-like DNA-binding protein
VVFEKSDIQPAVLLPRGPLARYVDRIFTLNPEPGEGRVVGLPQGFADIVFRAFHGGGSGFVRGDINAVGAQPQAFDIPDPELVSTLVVRFRPGAAHPFFRVPMRELTDRVVPLQELWGTAGSELLDRLLEAPAATSWLKLVESALTAQLERAQSFKTTSATVAALAADAIARSSDVPSVRAIAENLGLSERHLLRQFQEAVGLGPKQYARIARFERAMLMASQFNGQRWAELSLEAGYYDQAHLIYDCQKLTGMSPTQFLSAWKRGRREKMQLAGFVAVLGGVDEPAA